jgi:hypothetical protein
MTDEKTAAPAKKAGDVYTESLEAAVAALRHLLVTLDGAPGNSPYTNAAIVKGNEALAALDKD